MTRYLAPVAVAIFAIFLTGTGHAQLWTAQSSGTTNLLQAVWFIDARHGWAVGDLGTSLATADGGTSWAPFVLTGQDLGDVEFADASTGLIVGDNGTIFRTIDGGLNWGPVASGTTSNLLTVAFGAGGLAYAGGRDGVILRSIDSGASWSLVEAGADRYREAAARGTSAWFVGDGGVIRATVDGGATWANQTGTAEDLHDVFFLDANEGWTGGQNDTMLHTANGGSTWTPRNAGIFLGPDAISFVDSNEGWAVAGAGTIFHTTNGGVLWVTEASGTTNALNDVFFVSPLVGWTVGDLGTILIRDLATAAPEVVERVEHEAMETRAVPNPLRASTAITFSIRRPSTVAVSIHDVRGRLVRELGGERYGLGAHTVGWDGFDRHGAPVRSGTYFYRVRTNELTATGKLTVVR